MQVPIILLLCFGAVFLLVAGLPLAVKGKKPRGEEGYLARSKQGDEKYAAFLGRKAILAIQIACSLVLALLGAVFSTSLPRPVPYFLTAALFGLGLILPIAVLNVMVKRRKKLVNDQLVDAMHTIANGLKSGFSFQQSIEMAGRELPDPIGQEFRLTMREAHLGLRLEDALSNMVERVKDPDLNLMTTAVRLTSDIGGDLADVLRQLCDTIMERRRIDGKIDSLTSQGKLQALIVALVPLGLGIVVHMVNPQLMRPMYMTPLGWMLIAGVLLLDFFGFLMIRRIVTIRQ